MILSPLISIQKKNELNKNKNKLLIFSSNIHTWNILVLKSTNKVN